MAIWKRKQQECEGDYFFEGRLVITQGAIRLLSLAEMTHIVRLLKAAIQDNDGLDYLQVFESTSGNKVWIIDALSRTMKTDGSYSANEIREHDIVTILLPEEY